MWFSILKVDEFTTEGGFKGIYEPNKDKVGSITEEQLKEIAKTKLPDLNTQNLESAMQIVKGTAKNMGIIVQID